MPPPTGAACPVCGQHTLVAHQENLTAKRRPKFGVFWVLFTIFTGGLALIAYLIWPRHRVVVGVDRYLGCTSCGARV